MVNTQDKDLREIQRKLVSEEKVLEGAKSRLQEQEGRVQATRTQLEQIIRDLGGQLGLSIREASKVIRKPRAEKWRIEKFLSFIMKAHPTTEEARALLSKFKVSRATVYKYVVADTDGRYILNKDGKRMLDKLMAQKQN